MLKRLGFRKGEPRESEARLQLRKELFAYSPCVTHGFPHKPSALAYDPKLKLLAIGTSTGVIRIVGTPGVEYSGQHDNEADVMQLHFVPDQGRLVSVCSDNTVHMWEINNTENGSQFEHVKEFAMETGKLTTISACSVTSSGEEFLIGTEGGNIHVLSLVTFTLSDQVIYQDVVIQNAPEDYKVNPGAVEAIAEQPGSPYKVLIGYNRGLLVLWDRKENTAAQTYNAGQQLESVSWCRDSSQFMSSHSDGSYMIWSSTDSSKQEQTTPYGPFPCKAMNKVCWKSTKTDPFIVFSGGMPRASYGDRFTVSVQQGANHVVFDFTSKVVDFVIMCSGEDNMDVEFDDPHSLIVLAKEELVAIDLRSPDWQQYRQPYLCSLHSSAITCAQHVTNIPERLWKNVADAGDAQMSNYSTRDWPLTGGRALGVSANSRDMLLTGHEDGSVRFWDSSTTCLNLLYKLSTSQVFTEGAVEQPDADQEEEWPPFRKVGTFDPYSDDPRLGIQKIVMCPLSDTLVLGGTAGQIMTLQLVREERSINVTPLQGNIVSDRDNFIWKGHEALTPRNQEVKFEAGFQPVCVTQLYPPASCTSLALNAEWQIYAAGTAHGFAVIDYLQGKVVTTQCTLNPEDLGQNDGGMNRRKSLKKSLRESFRRLRSRRKSQRANKKKEAESGKLQEQKTDKSGDAAAAGTSSQQAETVNLSEGRNVERQVEARGADDALASMVRALYFADTFLLGGQPHGPTLWAGANSGAVYAYRIIVPGADQRSAEPVQCQLAKEIQLKHHAPVISICVIDRHATPLPDPLSVQHGTAKAPEMSGGHHHLIISSEEQFKVFSLPQLRPLNKFKLTAHEGSRIRKVHFVNYTSKSDENYSEADLTCLTNQGDLQVFTIPGLRRQLQVGCINKDNVTPSCANSGITSGLFTSTGQGFYLESPSEYQRFSLSVRNVTAPQCVVDLKEGVRPVTPELQQSDASSPDPPATGSEAASPAEGAVEPAATATAPAGGSTGTDAIQANRTEGAPADREEEPAPDRPNESIMSANESLNAGDITVDSVRIHMSEESSKSETHESSSSVTTHVVQKVVTTKSSESDMLVKKVEQMSQQSGKVIKTVERTSSDDSGMIVKKMEKMVVETSSSSPPAVEVTGN